MSEENVEVVRAVYERWSEGDFRASVDVFDPLVLMVVPSGFGPDSPDGATVLGVEAIAAYTRESLLETWADLTMEADEIVAAGECVLARVRVRGVGRTSGVPTEMRYFQLWSFRGGKVIRFESFRERAEALEAAGLQEWAMSEENVEIVRRHIEAFWSGDYDAALAVYDPDVEYDVSIRPEGRVYRGHAGVVEAVRTWGGTWEDWAVEVEEIIGAGDRVLVVDRHSGRGKGSGAPLDQQTFWVYTLHEGRIIRVVWFETRDEALEAAGLSE